MVGAGFGAVAAQGVPQPLLSMFAIAATIAVALAGYFGRELLTEEREAHWVQARILAEALQRECWKYLLRVPPYDTDEAGEFLVGRATLLMNNTGLSRAPVGSVDTSHIPKGATVDTYVQERALAQMQWYEDRSRRSSGFLC